MKGKVLLIDDDSSSLTRMAACLGAEGFTVFSAPTGSEGMALAIRERPGVIVQEALLPDIDGLELLSKLKALEMFRDTPVIILSSHFGPEKIERGIELGAVFYLAKHITSPRLLVDRVAAAFGGD